MCQLQWIGMQQCLFKQLKWNETLMKTVEPNVGALLTKEHSSTSVFNSFEVNPKFWSTFLKEGGMNPLQRASATMHFSFQLGEP